MNGINTLRTLCICAVVCGITACGADGYSVPEATKSTRTAAVFEEQRERLVSRHITVGEFRASIESPRIYDISSDIVAGVIPHHTIAASLISGFFRTVAKSPNSYDTVLIVAPNHNGDIADVIVSRRDWDAGGEISCDTDIIDTVLAYGLSGVSVVENDGRMEDDHSASVLMPYIRHYMPDSKVAPILVSRTLSLDGVAGVADMVASIIKESGKKVLLVCSADFSHYLTPTEAARNDAVTIRAVERLDYKQIHGFSNEYLDSPASLIIFLRYLESLGMTTQILDNTDASDFLGTGVMETTSYFVMMGLSDF